MSGNNTEHIAQIVDDLYRKESRRVFATLIRLLGDFDLAEDAMHDAFRIALEQWGETGIPRNPGAWLISTGRFKAIDKIRRQSRFEMLPDQYDRQLESDTVDPSEYADTEIEDDELRLIFTCCHPALSFDARVALTLREVCDLTTEEIAHAYLVSPSTLAQRIVRAKAKIRDAKIPYQVPLPEELPDRLDAVLQVIYLIFNEGYYATSGQVLTRVDLSKQAMRLGRALMKLQPDSEVKGLLAMMLLHESRHKARTTSSGDLILLEDQDRSLWDRELINEGLSLVQQALSSNCFGPYTLQAAIAAVHAEARDAESTDWSEITAIYNLLMRINPSPIVKLNRAVAIAMNDGHSEGLKLIDAILDKGELNNYHLIYAARAELYRRLGKIDEARTSFKQALSLAQQEPEKRFIEKRIMELT